ncbi:hypothetical protein M427DRAFT_29247 [Gonapodya prolifera JEL478]|uniref:Uncharacterized protein n=1 Tax=Gonapodya prolifera (strain JEL478) TaxID=1344416 RepID=A0A139ARF5_GONPJ|nr:hypothetical protein M427DRAFT_29247 [Gonapodya prolifera JEL478]|eukprot:KXS19326.1 hypothetical protein M427DRAFT_29247 [Gonapodya prolifera JEL478]
MDPNSSHDIRPKGAPYVAAGSGAKQNNFFLLENVSAPRGSLNSGGGGGGEQLVVSNIIVTTSFPISLNLLPFKIKSTATLPQPVFHLAFASAPSPTSFGTDPPSSAGYSGALSYPLLSSSTDGSVLFLRLTAEPENLSLDLTGTLPVFPKLPNEDLLASKPGKMSRTTRVWASEWIESSDPLPGLNSLQTVNPPRSFVSVQQGRLAVWDVEHCTAETGASSISNVSDDMLFCCKPSPHPATSELVLVGGADRSVVMCDIRMLGSSSTSPNRDRSPSPSAATGGVVFELPGAHAAPVTSVAWNPFVPYWVATAGEDAVVHVWDVRYVRRTREGWMSGVGPVGRVEGHFGAVTGVAWSNTHATVLTTASTDRTLRTWSFSPSSIAATTLYNPSSGLPIWDDDDPMDVANAVWWDAFEASGRGKSMVFGGLAGKRRGGKNAPVGALHRQMKLRKRGFKADPVGAWRGETLATQKGSTVQEKVSAPLIAVVPSPTHPFVVYAASATGEVLGRTILPRDILEGMVPHVYEKGGTNEEFWDVERKVFLREVSSAWQGVSQIVRGSKDKDKNDTLSVRRARRDVRSAKGSSGRTASVSSRTSRKRGDASDTEYSDIDSDDMDGDGDGDGRSGATDGEVRALVELCIPTPSIPPDAWGVGQYVSVGAEMAGEDGEYNDEEEEEKDLAAVAEGFAKDVEGVAGRLPPGYGWVGTAGTGPGALPSPLPSLALSGDIKTVDSVWLGGLQSRHRQEMDMIMLKMNLTRDVSEGKWEEVVKAGTAITKCIEWDGGIGGMWSAEEVKTVIGAVLLNDPIRALQLSIRLLEVTQDSPNARFPDLAPLVHFLMFPTVFDSDIHVAPPPESLGSSIPSSTSSPQDAKEVARQAQAVQVGGLTALKTHAERKLKAMRQLVEGEDHPLTTSGRARDLFGDGMTALSLVKAELNLFKLLSRSLPTDDANASPPPSATRSRASSSARVSGGLDSASINEELVHIVIGNVDRRVGGLAGAAADGAVSVTAARCVMEAYLGSKRFDEYFCVGMAIVGAHAAYPFSSTILSHMDRLGLPRLKSYIDSLYQQASAQLAQAIQTAQQHGTRDQLGQVLGKGTGYLKEALVTAARVGAWAAGVGPSMGQQAGDDRKKEVAAFVGYLNNALVGFVQQLSVSLFRILETMDRIVGRTGGTNYPRDFALAIHTPLTDAFKLYPSNVVSPTMSRREREKERASASKCMEEVASVVDRLGQFVEKG